MDATDYSRDMNALQWADLCASKTCLKTLKKIKCQSLKKTHKKKTLKDGGEPTTPMRKMKDCLGVNNNKLVGIETIVACVSVPTIPIILANAKAESAMQILDAVTLQQDNRKSKSRRTSLPNTAPPKIQITSDTGECIIPNKNHFTGPPGKKHSK